LTHRSGRTGRAGRKGANLLLVPHRAEHRVRILLREAKFDAHWSHVPAPKQVRKALAKRLRRELHDRLAQPPEPETPELSESPDEPSREPSDEPSNDPNREPISEADLDYAGKLLAEHDPQYLVATLLQMAMPQLPREPMGPAPAPERERATRVDRGARVRGRDIDPGRFVRFEINWGEHGGATPGRLLAHVCRRGGITSRSIGPVKIGRRKSEFEVAEDVAEDFARKVAAPDSRDPKLRIHRAGD
jgi:ATP-dependent RNA helicase DeaD